MDTQTPQTERDRIIDALVEEWATIRELASTFTEGDWSSRTPCPGWTSRDIIAHIIGTESMLAGIDTPPHSGERPAHVHNEIGELNEAWIDYLRDLDTGALMRRFDEITGARGETLKEMSDEEFFAPSWTPEGKGTYAKFMRIRIFDCWMHEQDLREAVGSPGGEDSVAARISVEEMLGKLGYIVGKRAGAPEGTSLTVNLTGPVGRSVSVLVEGRARLLDENETAPDPTVTITLPATVFARLYGGRVDAGAVATDIDIEGESELAQRVLSELAVTM